MSAIVLAVGLTAAVLAFTRFGPGSGDPSPTPRGWVTINDRQLGFSIAHPPGWMGEFGEYQDNIHYEQASDWTFHTYLRYDAGPPPFYPGNIKYPWLMVRVVTAGTLEGRRALADYYASLRDLGATSRNQYELAANRGMIIWLVANTQLDGFPALEIESTLAPAAATEPFATISYYAFRDDRLYVVALIGGHLDDIRKAGQLGGDIVNSFSWLK